MGERENGWWGGGVVDSRTAGLEWLRAVRSEAAAHFHDGGGLVNRGGRWGAGNAVQRN
jgi:hypothetical protein